MNYGYGFIRSFGDDKHIVLSKVGDRPEWFRLDIAGFVIHGLENEIYEEYYNLEEGIYCVELKPNKVKVFRGRR